MQSYRQISGGDFGKYSFAFLYDAHIWRQGRCTVSYFRTFQEPPGTQLLQIMIACVLPVFGFEFAYADNGRFFHDVLNFQG